ncbi:type I secretion system permease/ATPase [Aliirhizobium terrae]|uniref:type I secretion system permease/ATPase n=1 Tax=Terrirhizobium terrae TaxID=2926709 RepID=UPI0025755DD3|nr:type I secretion system permease/ATPase [Rhizobium sp. CC-CFT758]WJH41112.1 type I secretion system permease/ATPase [Rhizobium sp. CC-CFT758]
MVHTPEATLATQLSSAVRQCRMAFVNVAAISAVINGLFLIGPLFMLEVYDRVLPSHSVPTLVALLGIVVALYACQGMLDLLRNRILARTGAVIGASASSAVFRASILASLRPRQSGQATEPMRDLDQIRAFLGGPCPGALFDLPWIPVYMAVCFVFHAWIGYAALGGAAFLLMLTWLTDIASRKPVLVAGRHATLRNALSEDSCRNAEVVRALGLEDRLASRWSVQNHALASAQMRLSDIGGAFGSLSKSFRMFLQSGVLALGAYLALGGEVSSGAIVASGILVSRALAPVELSIANWRNFIAARHSWRRLTESLSDKDLRQRMPLPAPVSALQVDNLVVAAPDSDRVILSDASFAVEAGTAVAIVGPSAAGKSSLARSLVGLWIPSSGTVRLDGSSLDHWDRRDLGRHIGYLPQDVELFAGSIAENIGRHDPEARSEDVISAARAADIHDMILGLPLGYNTPIGPGGRTLSMGQRQRVGLARALYGNPFLVVLDEPNSNLDASGEAALTRAIGSVRDRKGIVIVIAHRASALSACDVVMMVSEGRAKMLGRKDDVVQTIRPHPARSDLAILGSVAGGAPAISEPHAGEKVERV